MKETPSEGTGVRGVLPFNVFIYPVVKTTRRLSWHRWLLNVIKNLYILTFYQHFHFTIISEDNGLVVIINSLWT